MIFLKFTTSDTIVTKTNEYITTDCNKVSLAQQVWMEKFPGVDLINYY